MDRKQNTQGPQILTEEENREFTGVTIDETGERYEERREDPSFFQQQTQFEMPRVKVFSLNRIGWKIKLAILIILVGLVLKLGFFVTLFLLVGILVVGLALLAYVFRRLF